MDFVDKKPVPQNSGARLAYRIRQVIAFPLSLIAFVVGGLVALAAALLIVGVVIAALAVGFLCLVVWSTALAISPHGINEDALE